MSNSTSGDVLVQNRVGGLLAIGTVDGMSGATNSGSPYGSLVIANDTALDVAQDVSAVGTVGLNTGDTAGDGDHIRLLSAVSVTTDNGSMCFRGGDDVRFEAGATATTQGTLEITANSSPADGLGAVIMAATSRATVTLGYPIDVVAPEDITLSALETTGEVRVTTTSGAIIDGGDTDAEITANRAALRSANGIGRQLYRNVVECSCPEQLDLGGRA